MIVHVRSSSDPFPLLFVPRGCERTVVDNNNEMRINEKRMFTDVDKASSFSGRFVVGVSTSMLSKSTEAPNSTIPVELGKIVIQEDQEGSEAPECPLDPELDLSPSIEYFQIMAEQKGQESNSLLNSTSSIQAQGNSACSIKDEGSAINASQRKQQGFKSLLRLIEGNSGLTSAQKIIFGQRLRALQTQSHSQLYLSDLPSQAFSVDILAGIAQVFPQLKQLYLPEFNQGLPKFNQSHNMVRPKDCVDFMKKEYDVNMISIGPDAI